MGTCGKRISAGEQNKNKILLGGSKLVVLFHSESLVGFGRRHGQSACARLESRPGLWKQKLLFGSAGVVL